MALPGVSGVAEGRTAEGVPCVVVLVDEGAHPDLPDILDGHPVEARGGGPFTRL